MIGDRIWLARFGGEVVPSTNLDAVPYEDFGELWRARQREDERIGAFASGLSTEYLGGALRYINNEGKTYEDPVRLLVAHLLNHQTHHTAARSTTCTRRPTYRHLSSTCTES